MYYCSECGLFEEPKTYSEDRTPYGGSPEPGFTDTFTGCPTCGAGYEEVSQDFIDYLDNLDILYYCNECGQITYSECDAEIGAGCHACNCIKCNESCDCEILDDILSSAELHIIKEKI